MRGYVLNGKFFPGNDLVIQPDQPFFAHGQGLFETLRARKGRPMFLARHLDRMVQTTKLLELPDVPPIERVRKEITDLVLRLGVSDARVKLHLLCKDDQTADFLITAEPVEPWRELFDPVAIGLAAPIFSRGVAMAGLKTMNYMANRLAEREGKTRGLAEVIFTTQGSTILEGTRTSIFIVRKGELLTAPLTLPILPGVVRAVVIETARRGGITVHERAFNVADVLAAEEAFLTGSVGGIRAVRSFEGQPKSPVPGPVTARAARLFMELLEREEDLL